MAVEAKIFSPDLGLTALTTQQKEIFDPEGAMRMLRYELRKNHIEPIIDDETCFLYRRGSEVFEYDPRTGLPRFHHRVDGEGHLTTGTIFVYDHTRIRTEGRTLRIPARQVQLFPDGEINIADIRKGKVICRRGSWRYAPFSRPLIDDNQGLQFEAIQEAANVSRARIQSLLPA